MRAYSTSEATKSRLVMAAGELFAQSDIRSVTTRAIAKKADENIALIKYHFGSKDGLLDAVVDFATKVWQSDPLGRYMEDNESLFESPGGQERLVAGLINLFFDIIFAKDRPAWCGMLMFQILQRNLPASEKIFNLCASPILNTFSAVYKRITGDDDPEKVLCWVVLAVAPANLVSVDPTTFRKIYKNTTNDSILLKLREATIRSALSNLRVRKTGLGSIIYKD